MVTETFILLKKQSHFKWMQRLEKLSGDGGGHLCGWDRIKYDSNKYLIKGTKYNE